MNLIGLEVQLNDPLPVRYRVEQVETRLVWETDGGSLYDERASRLSNFWTPPAQSQVSTVTVTYEAHYLNDQNPPQPFTIRTSATLDILSPSRSEDFANGTIDGYTIGEYPDPLDTTIFDRFNVEESTFPSKYPEKYATPAGFYKITRANIDRLISPHLTLRFFAMDYPWESMGFPQYIALDIGLVRKLEDLHALLNESGVFVTAFKPIYGFRKPEYNMGTIASRPDENLKAMYSMHQYGKAVDLIIDEDGDDQLDDLNGDGRVDVMDAAELVKYVNVLDRRYREQGSDLVGGAGIYDHHDFLERPAQSPYVHIDTRGYLGNGGTLVRWPGTWPQPYAHLGAITWGQLYPNHGAQPVNAAYPAP